MFYDWKLTPKYLCDKDDVKDYMHPKSSAFGTTYDNWLDYACRMASLEMARIAKIWWCVAQSAQTIYWDGDGGSIVQLPYPAIITITTIHDDLDRAYGADTLIDADDYVVAKESATIQLDNGITFTEGKKNIKIVGDFGWESDNYVLTHERDLVNICTQAVVRKFNKRLQLGIGTQQGGDGSMSIIDAGDFTKEEINYLKSLRPRFF